MHPQVHQWAKIHLQGHCLGESYFHCVPLKTYFTMDCSYNYSISFILKWNVNLSCTPNSKKKKNNFINLKICSFNSTSLHKDLHGNNDIVITATKQWDSSKSIKIILFWQAITHHDECDAGKSTIKFGSSLFFSFSLYLPGKS